MRESRGPLAALIAVLVLSSVACGSDDSVTGPVATLTSLQLTGNATLTAIGQTSQLTLNGNYSDGTTKNVTSEATWSSNRTSVATVSAGVVTAVSFGTATISANLRTRSASTAITAVPTGAFVLSGRVREPGGGSLTNVRVVEQISNTSKQTDGSGSFQFVVPAARLRIDLANYEPFEQEVTAPATGPPTVSVDAAMQRVIRIAAGQSTGSQYVAPNDVAYPVGADLCNPCKLVRVFSGGPTTLTVRLNWQAAAGALKLWANGTRNSTTGSSITINVPVGIRRVALLRGLDATSDGGRP